jgi:DNA-binding IclR family transcriptional regulator
MMRSSSGPVESGGDQLRSLTRAIGLLRLLAQRDGAPARLGQVVESSGLHKATAHRILAALAREGLVEHGPDGYALGPELCIFGTVAAKRFDIRTLAEPALHRIAERTGDVALLFVRSGTSAVCAARVEGAAPIIPGTTRVGSVKPLGAGTGALALLAAMGEQEAERILVENEAARLASYPQYTAQVVRDELEAARRRGFAVDEQVSTPDVTGVAVPILDRRSKPVASLCCIAFSDRLPASALPALADLLRQEADAIMRRLAAREEGAGEAS